MKLIYLSFLTWMAVACQETQPEAATLGSHANPSTVGSANTAAMSTDSDSSEGVVGPDEAYFAGVYLDSLFSASQSNPHLTLSSSSLSLNNNGPVEAFDFAANLQPKRMDLMGRILLKLGDKDADGKLSFEEFSSIKLIPDLQGLAGSAKAHAFDKAFFEAAAGEDNLLAESEIQALLAKSASASDLSKMSKSEMRKTLVSGWEKVIASYDADKDGKASLDEQRKLRKDRALIMSRYIE